MQILLQFCRMEIYWCFNIDIVIYCKSHILLIIVAIWVVFNLAFTLGQNTLRKMVMCLLKKHFYLSNGLVYGVLRHVIRSVWTRLKIYSLSSLKLRSNLGSGRHRSQLRRACLEIVTITPEIRNRTAEHVVVLLRSEGRWRGVSRRTCCDVVDVLLMRGQRWRLLLLLLLLHHDLRRRIEAKEMFVFKAHSTFKLYKWQKIGPNVFVQELH